jgi:hypothetical protein
LYQAKTSSLLGTFFSSSVIGINFSYATNITKSLNFTNLVLSENFLEIFFWW